MLVSPPPVSAPAEDLAPPPSVAAIVRFLEELEARNPTTEAVGAPGTAGANAARFGQELSRRVEPGVSAAGPGISTFGPLWSAGTVNGGFYLPSENLALAPPPATIVGTRFPAFPAIQEITEFLDWLTRLDLLPANVLEQADSPASRYSASPPEQYYLSSSGQIPSTAPTDTGRHSTSRFYEAPPLTPGAKATPTVPVAASTTIPASGASLSSNALQSEPETTETPASRRRRTAAQRQRERAAEEEQETRLEDEPEPKPRRRSGLPALEKALLTSAVLGATAAFGISYGREIGFAQGLQAAPAANLPVARAHTQSSLGFVPQWAGPDRVAPTGQPYATPDSPMALGHPPIPPVSFTGRATTTPTPQDLTPASPTPPLFPEAAPASGREDSPTTRFVPNQMRIPHAPFSESPKSDPFRATPPDEGEGSPRTDTPPDPWNFLSSGSPGQFQRPEMTRRPVLPLHSLPAVLTGMPPSQELASDADATSPTVRGSSRGTAWGIPAVSTAIAALLLLPGLPAQAGGGTIPMPRAAWETGSVPGLADREMGRTTAAGSLTLPTLQGTARMLSALPATAAPPLVTTPFGGIISSEAPLPLAGEQNAPYATGENAGGVLASRPLLTGRARTGSPLGGNDVPVGGPRTEGLPAPRPELGQLTIVAPPLTVSTPDAERSGVGMRLDWRTLAGGAGVLDAASLSRLQDTLPDTAQIFYPALPAGSLGANAVNLALDTDLVSGLLSRSYGSEAATLAGPSAMLGRANAGRTAALPLPTALVPTGVRPMGARTSLLGESAGEAGALESAGGKSERGGPLDLLGMPVRVAPSLAGTSELNQAVAVRSTDLGKPMTVRPAEFAPLKNRLFGAFQSVETEPDEGEWRKASPAFGLRDSKPTTLLAPDARAPRLTDTSPLPQMADATAATSSPAAALSPFLASAQRQDARAILGPNTTTSTLSDALPMAVTPDAVGGASPALSHHPTAAPHGIGGQHSIGGTRSLSPLLDSLPVAASSVPASPSTPQFAPVGVQARPLSGPLMNPIVPSVSASHSTRSVSPVSLPTMGMSAGSLPSAGHSAPVHPMVAPKTGMASPASVPVRSPMLHLPSHSPATVLSRIPSAVPSLSEPSAGTVSPGASLVAALTAPSPPILPSPGSVDAPVDVLPRAPLVSAPTGWGAVRPQMTFSSGPRPGRKGGPALLQRSVSGSSSGASEPTESGRTGEGGPRNQLSSSEGGASAAEVELLSTEVYSLLKRRLKNELERRGRW